MIIPFYIFVPANEFDELLDKDVDTRYDVTFDALEEETMEVEDIDKLYLDAHQQLTELLTETTASAIVYGTTDLDPDEEGDGMRANSPDQVAEHAETLSNIDLDALEDTAGIDDLTDIYTKAAQRGDAIVIVLN